MRPQSLRSMPRATHRWSQRPLAPPPLSIRRDFPSHQFRLRLNRLQTTLIRVSTGQELCATNGATVDPIFGDNYLKM